MMSTFPKTRAAAGYIARHAPGELARARAAVLTAKLDACEDIPAGGDVAAGLQGLLRDLVLAARDLAGPPWLAATSDDPDIAAFTALQATPAPPSSAELDEIISRVLWARFAPPGTPRDDADPAPGPRSRARYSSPQPWADRFAQPVIPGRPGTPAGDQSLGRTEARSSAVRESRVG